MNKKLYILSMVPLIFPILSREDIIPWMIALFFVGRSIQSIKVDVNVNRKIFSNILLSGVGIVLFNIISTVIQNYFYNYIFILHFRRIFLSIFVISSYIILKVINRRCKVGRYMCL